MAISSTQVANIVQGQVGMFSAAAQYAQAVSAQYGFQPSSASPIDDPRDSPALQGGMAASAGLRGLEMAGSAGVLAAQFGMGPRQLDPFTMGAHAFTMGREASGWAGGIGAAAGAAGAVMAVGSVFKWGVDQAVFGAQQHAMLNQQIGQIAPNMSGGQIGQMSSMVSQISRQGMGSVNELTALMQQGGADGSVSMQSLGQFQSSFQRLLSNVRQVASTLNSSLTEAQAAIQQVRGLGVGAGEAAGFLGTMRGIGQAGGFSPGQMMGIAGQGAQLGLQTGIGRQAGAMGQMVQAGVLGMVGRNGLIDGVDADTGGQYGNAAFRFLGSRYGRAPLAAMMGRNGEYDQDAASQIASGLMSREQMQAAANRNLAGAGQTDRFNARRQELMGRFVSDFGGQAIAPALQEMTRGLSNPESMRAGLTGLTRADQQGMDQLNRAMPGLRARLAEEGRAAFDKGTGGGGGLMDAIGQNVEQIIGPYRTMMQQYGAQLAQSAQTLIEDVTKSFVRQPPSRADPAVYARQFQQHLSGSGGFSASVQEGRRLGAGQASYFGRQSGPYDDLVGGLPSGLQLGALGSSVSPSELPMYGLAPMHHNPYGAAAALSAMPFGGRSLLGAAAGGIDAMGAGMMTAFASESTGFMGLGGIGMGMGTGRLAGAAMRGVGLAGRLGAGVLGAAAPLMLGADLAFNEAPEVSRKMGWSPISQGALMGQQADLVKFASGAGLLDDPLGAQKVGGWRGGMDYDDMQRKGLVPIGGMVGAGGAEGSGFQLAATQQQMRQMEQLVTQSGAALARFNQYGQTGQVALAFAQGMSRDPGQMTGELANQLGIPTRDAAQVILAVKAQGLQREVRSRTTPEMFRQEWRDHEGAYSGRLDTKPMGAGSPPGYTKEQKKAYAIMIRGMNPQNGRLGGKTIDQVMDEAREGGTPEGSPAYKAKLISALQLLDAEGAAGFDYTAAADDIISGKVTPVGMGAGGREQRWGDVRDFSNAQSWGALQGKINPALQGEAGTARQEMWSAATIAGVSQGMVGRYVDEFSQGLTDTGGNKTLEAPERLMQDMLKDASLTDTSWRKFASQMARGNTEASQRMAGMAVVGGRLHHDVRVGKRADQIITDLMGTKFDGATGERARRHFKLGNPLGAGIEAQMIASAHSLIQLTKKEGEHVAPEEADALVAQVNAAGIEYAKSHDKHAFDTVAAKIATMQSQAGQMAGGKSGDISKQMSEFMGNMQKLNEGMSALANNRLVQLALKVSAP